MGLGLDGGLNVKKQKRDQRITALVTRGLRGDLEKERLAVYAETGVMPSLSAVVARRLAMAPADTLRERRAQD